MSRSTLVGTRRGFTLLELMVALTIGASLLLTGRAIFDRINDTGRIVARAAAELDAKRAEHDQIRMLLRNVGVRTGTGAHLVGDEHHAEFSAWCDNDTKGWSQCLVTLTADTNVHLSVDGRSSSLFAGHQGRTTLQYLADASHGGRWEAVWDDSLVVPRAIAVISGADTTVLRIGIR